MSDLFKISATGLSMYYLPEYVAEANGYFEEVGIQKSSYVPEPWTTVLTDIDSGEYQAVIGGLWLPIIYSGRCKDYKVFCRMASRSPMALVSRRPQEKPFEWKDLEGKVTLCAGAHSIGGGVIVGGCAREAGCDMTKVKITHDFYGSMLSDLFRGGMGDYMLTKAEAAILMEQRGEAYLATQLCESAGVCPHSVYYATQKSLDKDPELFGRFSLAVQKGFDWLKTHDAYECKELIASNWPNIDINVELQVAEMFRSSGMWNSDIALTQEEFDRWQRMIADETFTIDVPRKYEDVVDSRPYEYVKKALNL